MSLSSAAIAAQAAALSLPALGSLGGVSRSLVVVAGGGRDLAWPPARIASQLLSRTGGRAVHLLLHGGARGADQAIARAADQLGWYALSLPAEWHLYGRGAGPIRNRQLLEQALAVAQARCTATSGVSVLVVAFPGGSGTASLVKQARRLASRSPVPLAVMEVSPAFGAPSVLG